MMARSQCRLIIRQQPARAQVVQENNPKNRKPIDPPPIIELKYDDRDDPSNSQWLVSPRTFMMVTLMPGKDDDDPVSAKNLIGQTVSSLHRLKDINNKDGGFFVFGDISAKRLGTYRLRFSLFDTSRGDTEEVVFMGHVDSDAFPVLPQRDFGSMSESTHLTRTFSDQGVKLRVRKDNRAISSIGTKRSYNPSPPDTSSPPLHTGGHGGAVQDYHYGHSSHSPVAKRHRSSTEYDNPQMYQGLPVGENPLAHYGGSIPSVTRSWTGSDPRSTHGSYSQQQSPLSMSMMGGGRVQPMGVPTATTWQGIHQQSALPSPTPSISNQQQQPTHQQQHQHQQQQQATYPSVSSQQQSSSIFGDPGAASSIPRNYYSNSYQYQAQGQYHGQPSGEVQHGYSDLQMPGSSIPDASGLASGQNQGYNQGYLQSGGIYATEAGEVAVLGQEASLEVDPTGMLPLAYPQ